MSVMSDLDSMVQEGARTAEDFEGFGIDQGRARLMEEVVRNSLPAPTVSVDATRLLFALRHQATTQVVFVYEPDDEYADGPHDFYWEDER